MISDQCNIDVLGMDELSQIFGFLDWKELLRVRVCQKWRQAVRLTQVPQSISTKIESANDPDYFIISRKDVAALDWMLDALPRLQTIHCDFCLRGTEVFKVEDGEDPFPRSDWFDFGSEPPLLPPVNLSVISRFRDLRDLSIRGLEFNGTYRFFFDFPQLESLNLTNTGHLRWDLSMLSGLPKLKKLICPNNTELSGDLVNLQVVQQTLLELTLCGCYKVEGSIMSLAKFPHLEELDLGRTKITGDIRDIGENDFVALKKFDVGEHVYGGGQMKRIEDAPDLMLAKYRLKKRTPTLFEHRRWSLSESSPQYYEFHGHHSREPPFLVEFVKAGPRLGWRWTNCVSGGSCETHWLDPEPNPTDSEYETYVHELKYIQNDVGFYQGFRVPPSQEDHEELNRSIPLDPMLRRFASPSPFTGWW